MTTKTIAQTKVPSDAALKELNMPEYLRACVVEGKTAICDASITYEVVVGDWIVWYRRCEFGDDRAHRAAGAAFREIAREQEAAMHEWADKILFARDEPVDTCAHCGSLNLGAFVCNDCGGSNLDGGQSC